MWCRIALFADILRVKEKSEDRKEEMDRGDNAVCGGTWVLEDEGPSNTLSYFKEHSCSEPGVTSSLFLQLPLFVLQVV